VALRAGMSPTPEPRPQPTTWLTLALLSLLATQLGGCWGGRFCEHESLRKPCGTNKRGSSYSVCRDGEYGPYGECFDPDVCLDGAEQQTVCGLNGRGTGMTTCVLGHWGETRDCVDPDACRDGDWDQALCASSTDSHSRQCVAGQWAPFGVCTAGPVLTIPVTGPRDMVHDAKRGRLYISSSGAGGTAGEVRGYDLMKRQSEPPLLTRQYTGPGSFLGIDLSPDEDLLAVADNGWDDVYNHSNWAHLVDLRPVDRYYSRSGAYHFTLAPNERGSFAVAWASNTELLVTSSSTGTGAPLRRLDLSNGLPTGTIATVGPATLLASAAGGAEVVYAQANASGGAWGRYHVYSHSFAGSTESSPVRDVAVNPTATQFALATYDGLSIFNDVFSRQITLGAPAGQPVSAVYSPVADELYLAWAGAGASIDVYSTATFQKLRDIDPAPGLFSWTGSSALDGGRLRISRDGKLLFATTGSGVAVYLTGR